MSVVESFNDAAAGLSFMHLSPTMTVNHVLCECPCTRRVFERLSIHPAIEGVDCLDEVAWRHGLSCNELIRRLEAAIAADTGAPPAIDAMCKHG